MARRKRSSGIALSGLQEALQTLPVREAIGEVDRRSLKRGRGLVGDLGEFKPSEVARALEISTQKYVAIRKRIEQGRGSSGTLNDLLEGARDRLNITPRLVREEFTAEQPDRKGRRVQPIDVFEVPQDWLGKHARGAVVVKRPGSKRSALNWLGGVASDSAKRFFVMVKTKKGGWLIYDIRNQAERSSKKQAKAFQRLKETTRHERRRGSKRSRR